MEEEYKSQLRVESGTRLCRGFATASMVRPWKFLVGRDDGQKRAPKDKKLGRWDFVSHDVRQGSWVAAAGERDCLKEFSGGKAGKQALTTLILSTYAGLIWVRRAPNG